MIPFRHVTRLAAIAAVALSASTSTLSAQGHPQTRQGFWLTAGLGAGSRGCEGCDDRRGGVVGQLALGGTISPRFQLGASYNLWTREDDGVTGSQSGLMALAKFYPAARGGFFMQGGLGVGQLKTQRRNVSVTEDGTSALIGVGYDLRVARNFSVTPFANLVGGQFDGNSANFNQLGFSLTWH
ncbi:MAG TPA: hypothetical protein VGE27_07610 [Gemmatimonas sp.]|uniref:hypothetical protein n=1 Tax=Gemmatimonas sp. TaxID=1962908 RepID=UPI002ED8CEE1